MLIAVSNYNCLLSTVYCYQNSNNKNINLKKEKKRKYFHQSQFNFPKFTIGSGMLNIISAFILAHSKYIFKNFA